MPRNHLHFVVEADDCAALSHGMQGLSVRIARRLNWHLGRRGQVFADRFRREPGIAAAVTNAVRYVIANYRYHTREWLCAESASFQSVGDLIQRFTR